MSWAEVSSRDCHALCRVNGEQYVDEITVLGAFHLWKKVAFWFALYVPVVAHAR